MKAATTTPLPAKLSMLLKIAESVIAVLKELEAKIFGGEV